MVSPPPPPFSFSKPCVLANIKDECAANNASALRQIKDSTSVEAEGVTEAVKAE